MKQFLQVIAPAIIAIAVLSGCDTGITGSAIDNQPPSTHLAVRDTSLVENLGQNDRLTSTVFVSWSGTDPDGFVVGFDVRFYDTSKRPGPEEGWIATTRTDSLFLLPIPRGERAANVVFEVRAADNEGLKDPTPARTVFPIENAPPSIRLSSFELPPDTTFSIFSFEWVASDPEGFENLSRIEVSFNDTTQFVTLDPEITFATFVADVDRNDASQTVTNARIFTGRAFQRTDRVVPGLRLNAENTFYIRAVDATDTTSVRREFTWFVRKPGGAVLFVNDFRKSSWPIIQKYHIDILKEYLPSEVGIDVWNLTTPYTVGSTGNIPRSDAMPPSAAPGLEQMFAMWDYIYWVSSSATNTIRGNNLPFAAPVLDRFFEQGGKMMVHTPMIQPDDPSANLGNPAIVLLPISQAITLPDSVRRIQLPSGVPIDPIASVPGVSEPLPPLRSNRFFISELPYAAEGNNVIPLYSARYEYRTHSGSAGVWPNPTTVASISADRRIALFALPLINDQNGAPIILGADGDPEAVRRAMKLILEGLEFPRR